MARMILKNWVTKGIHKGELRGPQNASLVEIRKDQPDPGSQHVLRPLNSMSLAYWVSQDLFQADKFFPGIPVEKQADMYWVYPRGAFLKPQMKKRGVNAESVGGGWEMKDAQYKTDVFAFHHDIPDQRRANEDSPLSSDRTGTRFVTWQALLHREQQFANAFLATGKWSIDWTGNSSTTNIGSRTFKQWDLANSTPIEDVTLIKALVEKLCGMFKFTKGLIAKNVWDVLKNHPEIIARIVYGGTNQNPASVTLSAVAQLFGLESLTVMESMYDSSAEGGTESLTYFNSNTFLLAHDPKGVGLEMPQPAAMVNWTGYTGTTSKGFRIKKFRMEGNAADRIEIEQAYAPLLIASDLGTLMSSCLATPG